MRLFLSELESHHRVEDLYYFPVFRVAEVRLARGFDALEGDHAAIHVKIARVVEAANALLRRMESGVDARRVATAAYADASERLLRGLVTHLGDEEDLVVPVILDRGEPALFGR